MHVNWSKKRLVGIAGLTAVVATMVTGSVAHAGRPVLSPQDSLEFEVASLRLNSAPTRIDPNVTASGCRGIDTKPDRRAERPQVPLGRCVFYAEAVASLIGRAYIGEEEITGGPDWIRSERYDFVAKAAEPETATERDLYLMLRNLLINRFKLKVRWEAREVQGYELVLARNPPHLAKAQNTDVRQNVSARPGTGSVTLLGLNASMGNLAESLSLFGLGPVADKTELPGTYDFELTFANAPGMQSPKKPGGVPQNVPSDAPSLFTALDEQLGLRLVSQRITVQDLVIESVERPPAN